LIKSNQSSVANTVGRSSLARYALALLAVILAWAAREAFVPLWGPTALPFIFFYPAIVLTAWYGRKGPALFAIALSTLAADWFFIEPRYTFWPRHSDEIVAIFAFVIVDLILVAAIELMHLAQERLSIELVRRRATESQLAAEKELLATTLTSMGDAVIVTNAQGRIVSLNREAERLTGWATAEAVGKPHHDVFRIVNEKTRQPADNPIEKALREGIVTGLANHTILISKDGREVPIDDSAAPIRHEAAETYGVVIVFRDVTEQRQAQRDRARLAEIVKYSGDAIFTKNLDGIITSWNESAKRLFGYEAEEIIGEPVTVLFPPDRLHEEDFILERLRLGQPSERLETIRLKKDGTPIHVSISVSPLKDGDEIIGASKIIHDVTDLVVAREQLIREKELLATTLASIGDAVILTDEKGCVTFLNAEAERLTAWGNDEARGRVLNEVFKIINEETRATVENPVEKVLRLGGVVGLANHTILITKDGREIPIDDSAAPIRQPGGPLFGIVLVFRDFSEHKRIEHTLRAGAERAAADVLALKHLHAVGAQCARADFDFAAGLNAILDAAIAITGADKGHLQLFDDRSGTLTIAAQRGFAEPFVRSFAKMSAAETASGTAMMSGERVIVEDVTQSEIFAGRPALGVLLEADVRAVQSTPLMSSRSKVMGIISTHFSKPHRPADRELGMLDLLARQAADYLERQEAEEALHEKEAELEAVINRTPFMLTRCTRDLRYRFVSRTYAQMLGREPGDIAGRPIVEIMGEAGLETIRPYIERALNGDAVEYESQIPYAGVGIPCLRVVYTPDRDAQGNVIGWVASIVDITDRKQAEADRERLLQTEQELRRVAEEANRLKDEFLAIMSHELRNPLNVILGYSELLVRMEKVAEVPELHRMAEAIKRNAVAQSKLIADLLDLSRLRSGKFELNKATLPILVAVENAIATVKSEADAKGITIDVAASNQALFVEADPVRLEQIIWNLLNNSVKFTPRGGLITVRLEEEGTDIVLTVSDNGQGIPESFLPHIFEIFRQADAGTSRAQAGMGIGLAVVQQLVELHGGAVTAHSEGANKGATFTIRLPRSVERKSTTSRIAELGFSTLQG